MKKSESCPHAHQPSGMIGRWLELNLSGIWVTLELLSESWHQNVVGETAAQKILPRFIVSYGRKISKWTKQREKQDLKI